MLNYYIQLEGVTMIHHCSENDVGLGETDASLQPLSLLIV
jgi:hypothetical protein